MTKAAFFIEQTAQAHLLLQSRVVHRAVGGTVLARVRFSKQYRTRVPTSAFAVVAYRHCARNYLPLLAQPAAHHLIVMTVSRRRTPLPARQRKNI